MEIDPGLVRLNLVPGITPRAAAGLRDAFGDPARALGRPAPELAALPGVGPVLAARIAAPPSPADARREIRRVERLGATILHPGAPEYPEGLAVIPDPPLCLYLLGRGRPEGTGVAVVGARRASPYGRVVAERFGAGLARGGAVVVSGLARGVDGAAHRGALDAGGVTVGVLGSGLDRIYPPEHRRLAAEMADRGFLCSELPLGTRPLPHHFPMRNRIIAGLAAAVVVVEGRIRSGSLITARLAADFGRHVFAVPGRIDSELAAGPHSLIREGGILATGPGEVLEDLGLRPLESAPEEPPPADPTTRAVLEALHPFEPRGAEEILEATGASAPAVLAALLDLELAGRIRPVEGRRWLRTTVRRSGE